jgi:hypothetical protein
MTIYLRSVSLTAFGIHVRLSIRHAFASARADRMQRLFTCGKGILSFYRRLSIKQLYVQMERIT